tara:strand:+ start:523 stop:930 length:408 start_codon:yes stop_codon:yes gene_type:complete
MQRKFLKKIIAQNSSDLKVISALCSEADVDQSEIKFLKSNKIFLITLHRKDKENINSKEKIQSVIKFEFIDNSKSKNINQNLIDNKMKLLAIDLFKKDNNSEIVLLFSNNQVITLSCEIIEVTLEDISEINDKNT